MNAKHGTLSSQVVCSFCPEGAPIVLNARLANYVTRYFAFGVPLVAYT